MSGQWKGWTNMPTYFIRSLLAFGLFLCLSACQLDANSAASNPMDAPNDLIPEKKFVSLLYEMNLLEGARTGNTLLGDSIPLSQFYQSLYQAFDVQPEQVKSSFSYYHSDPQKMATYYQWIIDSLRIDVQILSTSTGSKSDEPDANN